MEIFRGERLHGASEHQRLALRFGANFDVGRCREIPQDSRRRTLGEAAPIKIEPDLVAAIGGARERLHHRPIGQDIPS